MENTTIEVNIEEKKVVMTTPITKVEEYTFDQVKYERDFRANEIQRLNTEKAFFDDLYQKFLDEGVE